MKTICTFASLCALLLLTTAHAAESKPAPGKIDAVCVYRGQALVTRVVDIPGEAGLHELVVNELPEAVVPGSIYAESADGVEVRSVSYRVRPVEQDVREEVRKLDEQLQELADKLAANTRQTALVTEQKQYLDKLEGFVSPTASVELSRGVLNAETLEKLTDFQFAQRAKLVDAELKLGIEARKLNEQKALLERQRNQVAGSSSKLAREALVFVDAARAGGQVRLRYLVNNATWIPSYNVRSDGDRKSVKLEYLASIEQMSGEDWSKVTLSLSTATPSLVSSAPSLTALNIGLTQPQASDATKQLAGEKYAETKSALQMRQNEVLNNRNAYGGNTTTLNGTFTISGNNTYSGATTINGGTLTLNSSVTGNTLAFGNASQLAQLGSTVLNITSGNNDPNNPMRQDAFDADLNALACDLQLLDLLNREQVVRQPRRKGAPANSEGVSVTYQIAGRTSLPSRSDRQLIRIASHTFAATFYKVATPLLSSYVYDEARVINQGANVLLAGPCATYIDGEFVGQGTIGNIAVGEPFVVGLGIDSSLKATRELVEKTETTQGGNRAVDFTYKLAVENFGTKPAEVRLFDRVPTARESDIRVSLETPSKDAPTLSKDASYELTERKHGILRWDVEVPAQSVGTSAKSFEYSFKLEYDKQMAITSATAKR